MLTQHTTWPHVFSLYQRLPRMIQNALFATLPHILTSLPLNAASLPQTALASEAEKATNNRMVVST